MDPITARQVLRIFPDAPLTPELVERAHAAESQARHPSLYEDPVQQHEAEQWAQTLDTARQVLLFASATSAPDAASATAPRRGLSGGAIAGIVAGGVALLAAIGFAIFGAVSLVGNVATVAQEAIEQELDQQVPADDGSSVTDVERYEASETFFTFPAAIELYMDGRYAAECSLEYAQGCWQAALFTESDCAALHVELGFSNDADELEPQATEQLEIVDAVAGAATPVVFGNDDYAYGWINQVTCAGSP